MKHEDDMNCGNMNLNEDMIVAVVIANSPGYQKKKFGTSTGFEPMASALALRLTCNYLNYDYHSEAHIFR